MILRVLVGAAAVAIIGYVGFFAFDRFTGYQSEERAERVEWCDANRADLDRIARGEPARSGKSQRLLEYDARQCAEDGI